MCIALFESRKADRVDNILIGLFVRACESFSARVDHLRFGIKLSKAWGISISIQQFNHAMGNFVIVARFNKSTFEF